MYGLKKDVDLSFLNGREVVQIAIGVNEVVFAFDGDITISVEGAFTYSPYNKEGERTWRPGASHIAALTVALLGHKVERVDGQLDGTLTLAFSTGRRLTVLDSRREFESYQITRPGQTIVV